MANERPILITGATGRHGGTGKYVVQALLDRNYKVRALARSDDQRAQALRDLGAEVVVGDLHDRRTLLSALKDVESAYFTYPVGAGIVDAAANFVSAARANEVKNLVVMSMAPANPDSPSPLGRAQWLADELFDNAGFECLILRVAALFFENLELLHGGDIEGDGIIRNSFEDVALNWIAGVDAAKLVTAALIHPQKFRDTKISYPTGSEHFTHAEVLDKIGRYVGKKLKHETISAAEWEKHLVDRSQSELRIDAAMAKHISSVGAYLKTALPTNDLFEQFVGEPQLSIDEALRTNYFQFPVLQTTK
ncbi:MAG TPA: NmrA family NAD(P)-binding protein [Drouetiella sp.]